MNISDQVHFQRFLKKSVLGRLKFDSWKL